MKRKEAILKALQNRPNRYSYHESRRQTIARLLNWLSRANPLYDTEGKLKYTPSIRAYLLKYNREEYKKVLRAIKLNSFNATITQNAHGFISLEDLKPCYLEGTKIDLNLIWKPIKVL